ncbi:MAG TPA: hypothetical protein VM935_08920, partial [Chitinophagaceae bacterium]|nr:hypothetical protein [Chitinophagaceae bacterium]
TPTTTTLYFSVFDWPKDGKLVVPALKNEVISAKLLAGGDLKVKSEDGGIVMNVRGAAPDPIASVIKVEFKGKIANVNLGKEKMKTGELD